MWRHPASIEMTVTEEGAQCWARLGVLYCLESGGGWGLLQQSTSTSSLFVDCLKSKAKLVSLATLCPCFLERTLLYCFVWGRFKTPVAEIIDDVAIERIISFWLTRSCRLPLNPKPEKNTPSLYLNSLTLLPRKNFALLLRLRKV